MLLIYISNRFVRFLAEAAAGELDSGVIFELLLLKVTANSVILLPLSLFIGVLLAMGRLYRDSEIVAMQAGGVGVHRILRGIFAVAVVFACLVAAGLWLVIRSSYTRWWSPPEARGAGGTGTRISKGGGKG